MLANAVSIVKDMKRDATVNPVPEEMPTKVRAMGPIYRGAGD